MDLKKRLARLDPAHRGAGTGPASGGPICAPQDLGLEADPAGFWSVRKVLPLAPPEPWPDLAGLLSRAADAAPSAEGVVFLDLETTGLAGGTGTVPFLVGLAWWEGASLVVRQFFLPGPRHEAALLDAVALDLAGRAVVVSYNGASFDWPLLRTRALLNRRADPLAHLAGWDLVVPARRLWAGRLPDCRQQTLERTLLGRERGPGDIPGERIPQTWFDFLAGGDPQPLTRVLTHNRRDMAGMASILIGLAGAALRAAGPVPAAVDWREAWALGRSRERRGEQAGAAAWLAAAVGADGADLAEPRLVADALRILKRTGDWPLVADLIDRALAAGLDTPWLHREAAILREHRLPDLRAALAHARRSGDDHRVARLERRLAANAQPREVDS